jgi:hypothetical protein
MKLTGSAPYCQGPRFFARQSRNVNKKVTLPSEKRTAAGRCKPYTGLDPTDVSPAAKSIGGKHPIEGIRMISHGDMVFRTLFGRSRGVFR